MNTCPTCGALPCDQVQSITGRPAEVAADLRSFAIMLGPLNAMQARVIEAADEIDRLSGALRVIAQSSMSEIRPTRHEYHIGWQDVDGQYGPKQADILAAMTVARSLHT